MISMKKAAVALALGAAMAVAPTALAAAPPTCSAGSITQKNTCAFQGTGAEGSYSATAQKWAIYHLVPGVDAEDNPIEVRVDDLTSDAEALIVNDAGRHVWQEGVVYYVEVTNGIARAANA